MGARQATLLPTIVIDTREQTPWLARLSRHGRRVELPVVRRKLDAGDYSIDGYETGIAIERKSLADWVTTLFGTAPLADGAMAETWERFCRELERAKALQRFLIVVEASREDVYAHTYRSGVHPNAVIGRSDSILVDYGLPVIWAGDRQEAGRLAMWSLHRWWARQQEATEAAPGARP